MLGREIMKIKFKRFFISLILISLFIISLGFVSASNDSNGLSDMDSIDDEDILFVENFGLDEEISSVDINSQSDSLEDDDNELNDENTGYIVDSKLQSGSGNDFTDIQKLIDDADENDMVAIRGRYSGNSKIIINKTLTLRGDSPGAVLDGGFLTQILDVSSPNVALENIRFINSCGLSVYLGANGITVNNCSFENSINGELGSALKANGNNIRILNSNFLNNIANKSSCHHTDGPAIYLIGSNALIENCSFINNTGYNFETASSGGAIWLKGTGCSIVNSVFKGNKAISKFAWTLHSEEQTYLACGYGGAIYWVGNNGKIINCSFSDCISHTNAGAIYFHSSSGSSIINSSFDNNMATSGGGAIYLGQNVFNLKIDDSQFENNVALGLNGIITPYECSGGAICSGKFVENLSIFNSSFLNNYGNGTIYYLGSNLSLSNSLFDMPNMAIDNSTLERFLIALKNSTLEDCIYTIEDFSLYDFSGSLFETLIFTNGSFENNYWGLNLNSSNEFKDMKLIKSNEEYLAPNNWINLGSSGLNYLSEKGTYEYKFRFVLNDDTDALVYLPLYELILEHNLQGNLIDSSNLFIKEEYAKADYNFAENGIDILNIKNKYDKLLDSFTIICGAVFVEDSGNDTKDIQNAINNAEEGSVIVLSDRNYAIDAIAIDKNIVIYSEGLANISSSDNSKTFFRIASKEENPDLTNVEINGLNFIVKNGDILVSAVAINASNDDLIDIPNILIKNNNLVKSSEDVAGESVTVLKLSSHRAILATTGNISIIGNDLIDGANPFVFDITGIAEGSDVSIVNGSLISHNDSNQINPTIVKGKSIIASKDMTTSTVYSKDGKIGKYFTIRLTDSKSKALANKKLIINFNGRNYYRTTDKGGYVKIQINLAKKGTYTIVTCFLGDDKYNASFMSSKIKVNPSSAKVKVSNKKFKLKAKKTLTAKFLSPKGKAVKGKKISFRINGKIYTAKTNSKGIAAVKVKLNKRKTYKFTAKFAGDNTFKSISVKGKAVVK